LEFTFRPPRGIWSIKDEDEFPKAKAKLLFKQVADVRRRALKAMLGPQALLSFYCFKLYGRFRTWVIKIVLDGAYDSLFVSNVPFSKGKAGFKYSQGQMVEAAAWPPHANDTGW
jgi:hypothetical protein